MKCLDSRISIFNCECMDVSMHAEQNIPAHNLWTGTEKPRREVRDVTLSSEDNSLWRSRCTSRGGSEEGQYERPEGSMNAEVMIQWTTKEGSYFLSFSSYLQRLAVFIVNVYLALPRLRCEEPPI